MFCDCSVLHGFGCFLFLGFAVVRGPACLLVYFLARRLCLFGGLILNPAFFGFVLVFDGVGVSLMFADPVTCLTSCVSRHLMFVVAAGGGLVGFVDWCLLWLAYIGVYKVWCVCMCACVALLFTCCSLTCSLDCLHFTQVCSYLLIDSLRWCCLTARTYTSVCFYLLGVGNRCLVVCRCLFYIVLRVC